MFDHRRSRIVCGDEGGQSYLSVELHDRDELRGRRPKSANLTVHNRRFSARQAPPASISYSIMVKLKSGRVILWGPTAGYPYEYGTERYTRQPFHVQLGPDDPIGPEDWVNALVRVKVRIRDRTATLFKGRTNHGEISVRKD